ncbi:MAG: hypothetical protein ACK56Q_06065, partial [Pirellulaceae bacterium]
MRSLPEDCDGPVTPPPGTDDPAQSSAVEPNDGSLSSSISQPPLGSAFPEFEPIASVIGGASIERPRQLAGILDELPPLGASIYR